ncbi:hypothetical protein SISSUDRAFT_1067817 [Sistotremastrum suecicum HHB10207 ss-3]|nr:hypothetical protein SISSUDRAFT_1067817 [Sistotremastrum suecicum HHB10207 ss-3]
MNSLDDAQKHSLAHPDDNHCTQCPLVFHTPEARRKHVKVLHQPAVQLSFNGAKYKLYRQLTGTFACPVTPCSDGTPQEPFATSIPVNMQNHWNRRHKELHAGFLASSAAQLDCSLFLEDQPPVQTQALVIDVDAENSVSQPPVDPSHESSITETFPFGELPDEDIIPTMSPPTEKTPPPNQASVEDYDSEEEDSLSLSSVSDLDDQDADSEADDGDEDSDSALFPAQKRSQARAEQAMRIAEVHQGAISTSTTPPSTTSFIRSDHHLFIMGYVIHVGFGVAICTNCREAISPKTLIAHARTHGVPVLPQKMTDAVVANFKLVSPPQANRLAVSAPVPYLQPPVLGCFGCNSCSYAAKNSSTVKDHQKDHHPDQPRLPPLQSIHAQRLNTATQTAYFQVDISLPQFESPTEARVFLEKAIAQQNDREAHYERLPPTNKHVDIWPRKSRWHQALRSADRIRVHALGSYPSNHVPEDAWLLRIRKPVLRYFKKAIAGTAGLTPDTRAQLKNPYPKEFNHNHASYSEPQESVTFSTYARYGVQILATLLRSFHRPLAPHICALYQAVRDKAPGNQILPLIQPVFFSLVQRFSGRVADDDFRCPLLCANIATNVNAEGQLRDIRAISPTFTRLQWCIRAIVATHIFQRLPGLSEDAACVAIADLIVEHEPTTFGRNRRNIHTIKYIIDGSPSKPSLVFSEDGKAVSCRGDFLPLQDLCSGTNSGLDDVETEFFNTILRGLPYPELKALLARYYDSRDAGVRAHDNHRSTTPGYTFIWDKRNPFEEFRYRFLCDLVDQKVDCNGNNFWVDGKLNPAAIAHWNRQIALWWERTVIVAHMTAGGPSRAPELATTTSTQLHDGDRKVHCCQDHLCLLCTYSKSSENTSVDKMVLKPLPKRLSIIITMFLILVRPAEQALAPYAGMTAQQQENYASHLFVAEGDIIPAARIRFLMRKFSDAYFHVPLSFNQIRHILKGIILRESGYD